MCIRDSTRITASSATLIDHIYTNCQSLASNAGVKSISASDHYAVECTWSTDAPHYKKINHHYTYRRSYAKFNEACFLSDLSSVPFSNIYNTIDPNQAADTWCDTFLTVLNKHAPLKRHRVRKSDTPAWMTEEIRQAMKLREGKFEEFKNTFQKIVNTGFTCFFSTLP